MALTSGSKLGAYEIVSVLGAGGMGEVYRARDTRLGRDVALKVLRRETAAGGEHLKRFRREARAVAALNHPNIVTIHSVEEANDTQFFIMELVEGEPLTRLMSSGGLPLEKFFNYAVALADALAAAHEKGIVHRDLKPANIMVDKRGNIKVLDFGLAKVFDAAGAPADAELTQSQTQAGLVLGTLPYMSPEQLQGRQTDWRSDLFSAGTVLYEMATGQRPFSGETSVELASAILRDTPRPMKELRGELPSGLERILARCLAKDACERYASTRELCDALDKLRRESNSGARGVYSGSSYRASIAVLPFLNISTDLENEFFADGITEEIINALSQISELHVVARSSAFSFKGKHVDLRVIGEKLNVRTVLEGSVRKAGNRLRITVQLVNVANGYHLWSERYDRDMQDIFEIQDEIARSIAAKLKVTLEADFEEPLLKAGTSNLEAYQLYLKGRNLLYRRGLGIPRSLDCFQKAVELDPSYALAWAGLANACIMSAFFGFAPPKASLTKCKEAAERAVELNASLAEAHHAMACACFFHDWNHSQSAQEFLKALELNPRYIPARAQYGLFCLASAAGRFEECIAQLKQAVVSDPLSSYALTMLALVYAMAGRYAEALQPAQTASEIDPESFLAQWSLQNILHWQGDCERSIAVGRTALVISGRNPFAMAPLAVTYVECGRNREAKALYDELLARAEGEYVPPAQLAAPAAALGRLEEAIRFAREAFEMRDPWFNIWCKYNPDFARLRGDLRFREILSAMGLG